MANGQPDSGQQGQTPQPNIVFASSIDPDSAMIHDNETFRVQWIAFNAGPGDAPAFTDLLVISSVPEGCPGSDDQDHPVVWSSDRDGNAQDFLEPPLSAQTTGQLMQPSVGPFAAGSYRLTVTLGVNVSNTTNYSCVDIIPAS